jgi:hypothetical protein
MYSRKLNVIFLSVALIVLLLSVLLCARAIVRADKFMKSNSFYNDATFVSVMNDISTKVPKNEPIMISYSFPEQTFFLHHKLVLLYGISSEKMLVNYMRDLNYHYFLVFQGHFSAEKLKVPFTTNDFQNIGVYSTRNNYQFQLYQLRNPGAIES